MSRLAIRSLFPVSRASSLRRVWPAQLRLTGARQPAAGALGAALVALTVVAAVTLGVPAAPASATPTIVNCTTAGNPTGTFTIVDNVVTRSDSCTGTADIPALVTSIGAFAFAVSGLTSIVIPKSVTSIGDSAFGGNSVLTSVTFEKDSALQTIGSDAFAYSGLTSIVIPKSVTSIGDSAFYQISVLTSVTFEADSALQTIGSDAFADSGLTSIEIPKSVTSIGDYAFYQIPVLTSVTFEADSALQTIGIYAFLGSGLTSIEIPKSVTSIGEGAFDGNSALTSVTFEGNAPSSVGTYTFLNVADGATANIGFTATGFEPNLAGFWKGLVLVRAAAPAPSGPMLACMPAGPPAVGALMTCTVTGGDAGIDILWRAAFNPTVAEAGVTLDEQGSGVFSFTVPAGAVGEELTVELVAWTAPLSLGTVGGPVPTSVPSGGGPASVWTLGLLALAGGLALRRGSRPGRSAWRVG